MTIKIIKIENPPIILKVVDYQLATKAVDRHPIDVMAKIITKTVLNAEPEGLVRKICEYM